MNTKSLPLIVLGSITVAIHLIGFAAVDVGAHEFLAQSVSYRDLDLSRAPRTRRCSTSASGTRQQKSVSPSTAPKACRIIAAQVRRPGHRDDGCPGQ